jgi:hypothetical protein
MRMAPDHFLGNRVGDGGEIEGGDLLGHAGVEHDLQQQIAELILKRVKIALMGGLRHFIGLLDRMARDRFEVLFDVPRTAGHRMAKLRHDVDQAVEGCGIRRR